MKEFKGTKLPWIIDVTDKSIKLDPTFLTIVDENGDMFAKALLLSNVEECHANAKVMVAAPELLKALQNLVHLHLCEQEGISSGQPTPYEWLKAVEDSNESINKALN